MQTPFGHVWILSRLRKSFLCFKIDSRSTKQVTMEMNFFWFVALIVSWFVLVMLSIGLSSLAKLNNGLHWLTYSVGLLTSDNMPDSLLLSSSIHSLRTWQRTVVMWYELEMVVEFDGGHSDILADIAGGVCTSNSEEFATTELWPEENEETNAALV